MIVTSPFWLWQLKPAQTLDLFMLDKNFSNQALQEHTGLAWILKNQKYVKFHGNSYSINEDDSGTGNIKGTPLDDAEVIFLLNGYGEGAEGAKNETDDASKTSKVTEGWTSKEILQLKDSLLAQPKTLIAESNAFSNTTDKEATDQLSNLLDLSRSGWMGRYFDDLGSSEVPKWLIQNYQNSSGENWVYTSPGFVFVNQNGFVKVLANSEVLDDGVLFNLTAKGKEEFEGTRNSSYYNWFDIVTPRKKSEVLAEYSLPITKKAAAELAEYGIPSQFPAVIQHQDKSYTSYYFAGNYSDETEVPQIYQTTGLNTWKKLLGERGSFYWSTYVPLMEQLLHSGLHKPLNHKSVETMEVQGLTVNSQTGKQYMQILKNGSWEDMLIKGVNMGIAKPGHFPGETAISKEEYLRWFQYIGDMNANAIRVYTIHPPAFYEAFYEYNQKAEKTIFLFHGVWMNEENMVAEKNVFDKNQTDEFIEEIKKTIDVIHGKATIPKRAGHAYGNYSYDVSPYVLGFMIGTEWDPEVVSESNRKNQDLVDFNGAYMKTVGASPFEIWLAEMMDYLAVYEAEQYHWQHSTSFTNWVTTDLLNHPSEPSEKEDMVAIDPNHILKKDTFHAGMFASYHVYPYYPDFLNYEFKYIEYKDENGEGNNYEAYLKELRAAHQMPVLVAEFGVPASRGLTHENPYGLNQGQHSETEQGEINSLLFESIVKESYAGGMVFTWQDEWFKRTWNTMDYDNPYRRPYWSNSQTNEQHFGLLSFDPGEIGFYPDGSTSDWELHGIKPFYHSKNENSLLKQMFVASDESNLYIRLDYQESVEMEKNPTYLLFDTIADQGQTTLSLDSSDFLKTEFGSDFLLELSGTNTSRILVDSYYDSFYYHYGELLNMIPKQLYASQTDNGVFHPIRLALNKEMEIPSTGQKLPFVDYETGKLKVGNGNPKSEKFDSLTDISRSDDGKVIEIRVPWQLLNIKDPSTKEIASDYWQHGIDGSETISGIRLAAFVTNGEEIKASLPLIENQIILEKDVKEYKWENWDVPNYHERLKDSYYMMQRTYRKTFLKEEIK